MKKGQKHTIKSRQKMSESLRKNPARYWSGKNHSQKTKEKISHALSGKNHPNWGKRLSEETKKNISLSLKGWVNVGKRHSPETEFKKGHKLSPEKEKRRRRNISIAKKGKSTGSPSAETRQKLSNALKGSKSPLWKGGITPITNARIHTMEWREIAKKIRVRDGYICQRCGKRGFIVHHIIPWIQSHDDSHDNLITLCRSCHAIIEHSLVNTLGDTL